MKRSFFFLFLFCAGFAVMAGETPKQEFRGAWVTTVWGLDWPSSTIQETGNQSEIEEQKQQFIRLIESLKSANINAVFFQVRSECDAMYESSYEPWSTNLVVERGMDPGYDPLAFVVEECHKRGIEVHAWLNPYRFETVSGKYEGLPGDYRQNHPEWVLEYPEKSDGTPGVSILDPGNPEVRERIADVVEEIVTQYDVDGVVFDDYFYSYGGTPADLDSHSQEEYKPSGTEVDDWRRENINKMISSVYDVIRENKPGVTFGVSPFGIWTTDEEVAKAYDIELPEGITGMNAYDQIYCDPLAWLEEGTVDYLSPQIYWPTTSTGQNYEALASWWSDVCNQYSRHLYVSHSLADLAESNYAPEEHGSLWKTASDGNSDMKGLSRIEYFAYMLESPLKGTLDPEEFGKQIDINRREDRNGAPGSVFFRATLLYTQGFINYLTDHVYTERALVPALSWKALPLQNIPENIRIEGETLRWDTDTTDVRFAVYAAPSSIYANEMFGSPEYLVDLSYEQSLDLSEYSGLDEEHRYGVSMVDRYGNESPPALMNYDPPENQGAKLVWPEHQEKVSGDFVFMWDEFEHAYEYMIEIAGDPDFEELLCRRMVTGDGFDGTNVPFQDGRTYYWRLTTRVPGTTDETSEIRAFEYETGTAIHDSPDTPVDLDCPGFLRYPETNINFSLSSGSSVRLTLLDIKGRVREVLLDEKLPPGNHSVTLNSSKVEKGIYFLYFEWTGGSSTCKMMNP